jgi:hypothetical protein
VCPLGYGGLMVCLSFLSPHGVFCYLSPCLVSCSASAKLMSCFSLALHTFRARSHYPGTCLSPLSLTPGATSSSPVCLVVFQICFSWIVS